MRIKLGNQSSSGILQSLIARLVFENQPEGLQILLHALRYLNGAALAAEHPYDITN